MAAKVSTNRPRPPDFFWVGNAPALDFVNTTVGTGDDITDLLRHPEDLGRWLLRSGLVSAAQLRRVRLDAAAARRLLHAARKLRAAIRQGAADLAAGRPLNRQTIALLNRWSGKPAQRIQLRPAKGRRLESVNEWLVEQPADLLRPIAADAIRLFTSADPGRIRRCASGCVLYFLDTSKSGRRQWCSMAVCGNRAKVADFRRRMLQDSRLAKRRTA